MMEHCKKLDRDFPDDIMAKILTFQCRGTGLIPGQGTKTLHAMREGQKTKINELKKKKNSDKNPCPSGAYILIKGDRNFKDGSLRKCPGGPIVRTQHFHCRGP